MVQTPPRQNWLALPPSRATYTQRQVSAGTPAHESPLSPVPRWPYWQSAQVEQVSVPPHTPSPQVGQEGQAVQRLQVPQVQVLELQVRVRDWVPPQVVEQARSSRSVAPGAQVALVVQEPLRAQTPKVQLVEHRRVSTCVPSPQAPQGTERVSTVSGAHTPSPAQPPSFTHSPASQTCRWVPQAPQGTSRGAAPSSQEHSVGALHSVHTPSAQSVSPSPHRVVHRR